MARHEINTVAEMAEFVAKRQTGPVLERRLTQEAKDKLAIHTLKVLRLGTTNWGGTDVNLTNRQFTRRISQLNHLGVTSTEIANFLHPSAPKELTPEKVLADARAARRPRR